MSPLPPTTRSSIGGPYRFDPPPLLFRLAAGIHPAWVSPICWQLAGNALIIVVLPVLAAFMQRIRIEEAALSQALGERYTQYMARTKRLIPGVY